MYVYWKSCDPKGIFEKAIVLIKTPVPALREVIQIASLSSMDALVLIANCLSPVDQLNITRAPFKKCFLTPSI